MERIKNLVELGARLATPEELREKIKIAEQKNPWFVSSFVQHTFDSIIQEMLNESKLIEWLKNYELKEVNKTIGLIFAGNIPLVGFHDFLCCYIAGCKMKIKLSSKDEELFLYVLKILSEIDSTIKRQVEIVERLNNFDAVIATGNNNSNRYFEYYFRDYPKILRKNRNSIAILNGEETEEELLQLSDDVFLYFGFGCRNASKLYLPNGYDVTQLLPAFEKKYKWLHGHNKFMSNYDYNRTLLMLNKTPHLANEFIQLVENISIPSSIAPLNYEFWKDENELAKHLKANEENIQCVVSKKPEQWKPLPSVHFGQSQQPQLSDYADGVDTLKFLLQ